MQVSVVHAQTFDCGIHNCLVSFRGWKNSHYRKIIFCFNHYDKNLMMDIWMIIVVNLFIDERENINHQDKVSRLHIPS